MSVIWKTGFGRCIDQKTGVYVYQNPVYRWLQFDSAAIQTLIHRYYPHRYGLKYLKPFTLPVRFEPGSCCLLGLGGGGVIHALHQRLQHTTITAVESNINVIQMALKHFMLAYIKNLDIIHQDANLFIQTPPKRYQYLLIDLYSAHHFPACCQQSDFFSFCRQMLEQDGILCMNIVGVDDAWAILKLLRLSFGQHTLCLPVKGTTNIVILAIQENTGLHYFERLLQFNVLKRIVWDVEWGYIGF